MGRSGGGGGGGGGGFSGGGFGGGGGFSGGGRSGGFSGGGGRSGGGRSGRGGGSFGGYGGYGGFGGIRTGPIFVNNSRRYTNNGGGGGPVGPSGGNGSGGGRGCGTLAAIVIAVVVLLLVIGLLTGDDNVDRSTVAREPLPAGSVQETGYYTDEDGGWIQNRSAIESGMRAFYRETGVQPYVYILKNGTTRSVDELSAYAERLYTQLFQDQAHFLLVFCDDGDGSYNCGYMIGAQAKSVMDGEAISILADYLDRHYNDYSISEEEIFSNTFQDTGERIMTVTKSPVVPVAVCIAVVAVLALLIFWWKKRAEQREREQKHAEEILNTPLERFGDQEAEDLAKKYEDKK